MHRSYRNHAPVQIIRYSNRLEIRNPGFSLKSPEHLGEPGSQPRNPRIAAVLHETRFAETKGSGIRVMREMMERAGLSTPVFESDRGSDQFVARYLFHHFLGHGDVAWLGHFRELHLTDEEAKALIFVREAGAIDNATFRELNKVDPLVASQALRRLRDAKLLDRQGRGSATYYVRGERLRAAGAGSERPEQVAGGVGAVASADSSLMGRPVSGEFASLSGESSPLSGESFGLSGDADASVSDIYGQGIDPETTEARRRLLEPLPGDLAARLGALGRRGRPEDFKAVLLDLLRLRPWPVEELATVLGRNPKYVREQYLQQMVRDDQVVMTRPQEPNHPEQAYQAVDAADAGGTC